MGFPMHRGLNRAALIGVMLGGGLLYAGISQAQEADVQAERGAELVAASGGPASSAHLIAFARDAAAVDVREDDVAGSAASTAAPETTAAPAAKPVAQVSEPSTDARQVAAIAPADGRN